MEINDGLDDGRRYCPKKDDGEDAWCLCMSVCMVIAVVLAVDE